MPRSHYGTCAALIKASCRTICLGDRAIFTHTLLCVHQSVFVWSDWWYYEATWLHRYWLPVTSLVSTIDVIASRRHRPWMTDAKNGTPCY